MLQLQGNKKETQVNRQKYRKLQHYPRCTGETWHSINMSHSPPPIPIQSNSLLTSTPVSDSRYIQRGYNNRKYNSLSITQQPKSNILGYFTNSLTPCSTVLPEKLTGSQLVKKFPVFYGTRRFITAFTSVFPLWTIRNMMRFLRWRNVGTSPNSQDGGPPRVGYPRINYSMYSLLTKILEAVTPSTTRGRAISWWQGTNYHGSPLLL